MIRVFYIVYRAPLTGILACCGILYGCMSRGLVGRKYARCSPGDPHHTTVSCKGELGLLCTNLLFKLGLARISTEQVEKRVERMRGDTGRVRLAEAEFVAWFSEAFVLTQDSSLTSQRYDGDDIWAR